ncbi:hypothetical protein HDU88_002256 [Geranomyces variabilis]|nr:hypothetical protein HDU88_002256 [Geranomyces variabilis]
MRLELITLVAAASCVAAAPAYYHQHHSGADNNKNDNYNSDNDNSDKYSPSSQYYAPCPSHSKQPQTWWDDSGNHYGWDANLNKACLINWKPTDKGYRKHNDDHGDDDDNDDDNSNNNYHKSSNAYLTAGASDNPNGWNSKHSSSYSGNDDSGGRNYYSPDGNDYSGDDDYSNGDDHSNGNDYSGDSNYSHGSDYHGGENSGYSSNTDCSKAAQHFKSTHSPTLIQCVSIACAPGQSKAYTARALYQCAALESSAKANNGGVLPKGW